MERTEAYQRVKTAMEQACKYTPCGCDFGETDEFGHKVDEHGEFCALGYAEQAASLFCALMPPPQQPELPNSYEEAKALGWNCSPFTWEAVRESVREAQQPARGTEVERVARALAAEDYRQKRRGDYNDADTYASRHWGEYQSEARVAIEALQTVTKEE